MRYRRYIIIQGYSHSRHPVCAKTAMINKPVLPLIKNILGSTIKCIIIICLKASIIKIWFVNRNAAGCIK